MLANSEMTPYIYATTAFGSNVIPACRGSPPLLTESNATLGINETEYEEYAKCAWKIQVDASKVCQLNIRYIYIYIYLVCCISSKM